MRSFPIPGFLPPLRPAVPDDAAGPAPPFPHQAAAPRRCRHSRRHPCHPQSPGAPPNPAGQPQPGPPSRPGTGDGSRWCAGSREAGGQCQARAQGGGVRVPGLLHERYDSRDRHKLISVVSVCTKSIICQLNFPFPSQRCSVLSDWNFLKEIEK